MLSARCVKRHCAEPHDLGTRTDLHRNTPTSWGWLSGHFLSTSLGWRTTEVRTNWMTPLRQHACKWLSATLIVRVGKRLQMEPDRHS